MRNSGLFLSLFLPLFLEFRTYEIVVFIRQLLELFQRYYCIYPGLSVHGCTDSPDDVAQMFGPLNKSEKDGPG